MSREYATLCSGFGPRPPKRPRGTHSRNPFALQQVRVADLLAPRYSAPPVPQERPSRTPVTAYTARGAFPSHGLTDEDRENALNALERDMTTAGTSRVRQSNWRTWMAFHMRWHGAATPPLPLTPESLRAVAAQMKEEHYRSFPNYLTAARENHLEAGHLWSDELDRTRRRSVASTQRGIGPARQSIEIQPQKIMSLRLGSEALHDQGPVNPQQWAILCAFHMLRGAESACALAKSLKVDTVSRSEVLALAGSKTDPQATGCKRSWSCVCNGDMTIACPYHAALTIRLDLGRRFGFDNELLPPGLPLFPTASGEWCSREGFIATIRCIADQLCLDPIDEMGRCTIGEHVWRVSGARMLALARVPIPTIALMARWGSDIIMRYVELAPLATITATYVQGASGSSHVAHTAVPAPLTHAISMVQPEMTHDEIAEESLEPPVAHASSRYALNNATGVLHIVARRKTWGRLIPGRTNCGRDYLNQDYKQVCALTATYTKSGVALTNTKCNSCARPDAWASLATGLDDASDSDV
jgi:hypothetical protein